MEAVTARPDEHRARSAPLDRRTIVARSFQDAGELLPEFAEAAWPHQDSDPEYFRLVVETMPGAVGPYLARVASGAGPSALVAARLERATPEARLGYLRIGRPLLRCLTVVHGGVIGADDPAISERVVGVLARALASGEADAVRFLGLRVGSELHRAVARFGPWHRRDRLAVARPHWRARVPATMQEFLAARSRNTRQNLHRYGRRLERDLAGRLAVRRVGAGVDTDLERLLADLDAVASLTYQRGLGVGFTGDSLQRRTIELELRRRRYLAWFLDVDGVPRAFWDGSMHRGTFYVGSPGYDPALGELRPGTWLQMRMIEDLCARDDVEAIDYGMGDAQYKRSFGDESWDDAIVHVFAPSARGLAANAVRTATLGSTIAARRLAARTGLEQRLKRRLRVRAGARGTR